MSNTKQAGPIGSIIIGIILIAAGYFVAFHIGLPTLKNAKASTEWPTVTGDIVYSKVRSKRSDGKTMYSPDVQYNYVIDGRSYKGSNIAFGSGNMSSSNSSSAYDVVNKYNKGKKVNVFYSPNEPHNSVLEPGANWSSYIAFTTGLLLLVIGILIIGSSILKIIFGTAIIIGAIGGLIGKKPKSFSNKTSNKNNLMAKTKSKTNSDDDGFDLT